MNGNLAEFTASGQLRGGHVGMDAGWCAISLINSAFSEACASDCTVGFRVVLDVP
jgi:hypothetical protein